MENLESYNHLIEHVVSLTGKSQITKIILLGSYKNKVSKITINLISGKVSNEIVDKGKEYNNKAVTGWKKGIIGKKPIVKTIPNHKAKGLQF